MVRIHTPGILLKRQKMKKWAITKERNYQINFSPQSGFVIIKNQNRQNNTLLYVH